MNLKEITPERYELGHLIGEAGQSRVFDSQDLQTGERVAVKYVDRKSGGISAGLAELSALLAVNHPNVVPCVDFHYLENGATMIVYAFIEGGTLRDYLTEGKAVSSEFWQNCAHDILAGLEHLHQKNLIHCDLKPENILIEESKFDGSLRFKIADLGISRFKMDAARTRRAGSGSPAYMSPEAFNGSTSPASDLYTVGVILYEMAAGQRPFDGSIKDLARAHAQTAPDLDHIHIDGVAAFINSLLQKNPRNRICSATEALRLLPQLDRASTLDVSEGNRPNRPMESNPAKDSGNNPELQPLDRYEFITEFDFDSLASDFELLEVNNSPVIAAIHSNHIELFDGTSGKPLNRFISKIGDHFQILENDTLITSDPFHLYQWSHDFRSPEKIAQLGQSTSNAGLSPDRSLVVWAEGSRVFFQERSENGVLRLAKNTNAGFSTRFIYPEASGSFVLIPGTLEPEATWFDLSGNETGKFQLNGPIIDVARISLPAVLSCPTNNKTPHALELVFFGENGNTTLVPLKEVPRFYSFCNDGLAYANASGTVFLCTTDGEMHHLGETGDLDSTFLFPASRNFFYSVRKVANRRKFQLYHLKLS